MSDSLLSFIIIFAEIGGVLLLLLIGWIVFFVFKLKKDGRNTRELVSHIKLMLPKHREKLTAHFKEDLAMDDNKVASNVESLLDDEKKLYEHLVNVAIQKDTGLLKLTINDINTLLNDYVRMLTLKGHQVADNNRDSRELQLRKENEALRLENASLATRLATSNETIENMMGEFSSMYEGGKKEGEKRVKNEMYKLKQSLDEEEARVKSELSGLEAKDKTK
ncbi:MAG: hypothetical protein OQK75_02025 [Gammaproteobacteria bacterium]|nr:hypothetical protein [Gammaproteobacteria bacterium]MCW8986425.1 hypothetical protein [Gammaproteobacteria bacterium]MCW9030832.1 hypothetical protein [Gammaproteobacteria bacterium]